MGRGMGRVCLCPCLSDDYHRHCIRIIIITAALFFFIYVSSAPLGPTGKAEDALMVMITAADAGDAYSTAGDAEDAQ